MKSLRASLVILSLLVTIDIGLRMWPEARNQAIKLIDSARADSHSSAGVNVTRGDGGSTMTFPHFPIEKGRARLFHVSLIVKDLEKSADFYQQVLGFKVMRFQDMGVQRVAFISTGDGEPLIELTQITKPLPNLPQEGFSHLGLFVENVDDFYDRTRNAGATWSMPPGRPGPGAPYMGFVEDPDGYRIEVLGNPQGTECTGCHRGPHLN